MQTDSELPTTPGVVIAGKYRVEGVIGEGGMGAIVKARHLQLNRDVAIKLMRSEISGVHKASERFLREARATANIDSDYVARVSDIDVLPSGMPFIVMEFLDGVDLANHVADQPRRDLIEAVDWMLQALSGLVAAHTLGIVHRDLKPTNLFLVKRPDGSSRLKVLDFGVSKVLDDSDFSRDGHNAGLTTASNFVVGTPRYMAPEQITAPREVDERADLWAVGLILYEFLVGAHPFDGKTPGAIMGQVLAAPVLPVDSFRADVPLDLAKAIERCLQRDRNLRFDNAPELLRALAPFATPALAAPLLAALPKTSSPRAVRVNVTPGSLGGFAAVGPGKITPKEFGGGPDTGVHAPVQRSEAATVHTPSEGGGSLAIPVSVSHSGVAHGKPGAGPANRTPGTLLEWNQERDRERPKKALLLTALGVLLVMAGGAWFFFAQSQPTQQLAEPSPVPMQRVAPGGAGFATTVPPAAPPEAPLTPPSEVPPSGSAAPRVVPIPSATPQASAVAAANKAAPQPTATPAAPQGKGVSSTKKPAKSPPETTKPKDSILGTRN